MPPLRFDRLHSYNQVPLSDQYLMQQEHSNLQQFHHDFGLYILKLSQVAHPFLLIVRLLIDRHSPILLIDVPTQWLPGSLPLFRVYMQDQFQPQLVLHQPLSYSDRVYLNVQRFGLFSFEVYQTPFQILKPHHE